MNNLYAKYIKRVLDLALAIIVSPIFLLIFVIIAPFIFFEDKGSIMYKSKRRGYKNQIFYMYKFRSMKVNAPDVRNKDNTTFSSKNDPRVTHIGMFLRKTSIDELPQIINIIKGDMSWVGPRATMPQVGQIYVELTEMERKKLSVRPGITGYTAALYRNSIDKNEKLKYDGYYVDNISFILDIKIVFWTFKTVVLRKNLYTNKDSSVH